MSGVTRHNDIDKDAGHNGVTAPKRLIPLVLSGVDVFVNGDPAAKAGYSQYDIHILGITPHFNRLASTGSSSVFINSKPVHRKGDSIQCGDVSAGGSDNVICGG